MSSKGNWLINADARVCMHGNVLNRDEVLGQLKFDPLMDRDRKIASHRPTKRRDANPCASI